MKYIYAHNPASEGARALSEATGYRRLRHQGSRFRGSPERIVINWGAQAVSEEVNKCRVLNHPSLTNRSANKLTFFQSFTGEDQARVVPWTTSESTVKEWLEGGHTVCARTVLNGSSGAGLVLFDATQKFVPAPLWTRYVKKKEEYRIHVMNNEVISIQKKAMRSGETDEEKERYDRRIRNLGNGFVFIRNEINPPGDVITQSLLVFRTIPLDFGAVDVIWNDKQQRAYVLEVNTAPGLEGTTVTDYAEGFKRYA